MEKRRKRGRGSNWNHAHTMALAELKREASLNKEDGRLVWERIAQTLSSRFPGHTRTGDQCRRRWDTLVKVYNHIEDYCVVTGAQDHRELDKGELASMKLDTAYQQDWYDIVEQVCSQRRSKERCDRDLRLAKRSTGSHSVELPERPPNRDTASTSNSVTHREEPIAESFYTSCYKGALSSPTLEVEKVSPEEEVPRLEKGNDGLMLEVTQPRQHGQVSHEVSQEPETLEPANLLPYTFTAEDGAQLKELLQDYLDSVDAMPCDALHAFDTLHAFETSAEIEQSETESELTEPFYWDSESIEEHQFHRCYLIDVANASRASNASNASRESNSSGFKLLSQPALLSSAIMTSSTSSRSADSTISRQSSRRWSLKVIVFNVLQCCHACGRKERVEDMEMESKQAARLKEKARKKAPMSRKENVPAMFNAASSTGATSATRGDKPLKKDTERTSKQAALDKKDEEPRPRKAERQQLGGKSSSKYLPIGKLCAKLRRKLFRAFHGQSSQ